MAQNSYIANFFTVFLLCICVCSCAKNNNVELKALQNKVEPADQLYNEALANYNIGRYKEAALKFDAVQRQHPQTSWAQKALLMQAYSYYKNGSYNEAIAAANSYLSQYPKTKDSAYVSYIIGMSYFKLIPDVGYDQANSEKTIKAMESLIKNYPKSKYIDDAKAKIRFAKAQIAEKNMRVARYYESKGDNIAALKRLRYILTNYSDTSVAEEALYRCVEIYDSLGLNREAATAAYVLGYNYPNSFWYKKAYQLLEKDNIKEKRQENSWLYKIYSH